MFNNDENIYRIIHQNQFAFYVQVNKLKNTKHSSKPNFSNNHVKTEISNSFAQPRVLSIVLLKFSAVSECITQLTIHLHQFTSISGNVL